jgi:hypothetical protein
VVVGAVNERDAAIETDCYLGSGISLVCVSGEGGGGGRTLLAGVWQRGRRTYRQYIYSTYRYSGQNQCVLLTLWQILADD